MRSAQWDELADSFEDEVCDISREETDNRIAPLVRLAVPLKKPGVLIDLGCGLGSFLLKYRRHFSRMIAVDFSPAILARAQKRCAKLEAVEWHCESIPAASRHLQNTGDLTVCMNVITAPDLRTRRAIWKSVTRVTKPGGHALLVLPSLESERMVRRLQGFAAADQDGLVQRDDAVQRHFLRGEIAPVLAQRGFESVRIKRVYYPWRKEGMRKPRGAKTTPWDWLCLAQRTRT